MKRAFILGCATRLQKRINERYNEIAFCHTKVCKLQMVCGNAFIRTSENYCRLA